MSESETQDRRPGTPPYEKLVWQGDFGGETFRIRIIRFDDPDGSPIYTEIDKHHAGVWEGIAFWHVPNAPSLSGFRLAFIGFVEAMIDLMGRPEWDTRPRSTSVYPPKLLVADGNGQVIPTVTGTMPAPASGR